MTKPSRLSPSRGEHLRAKLKHANDISRKGEHDAALGIVAEVEEELSSLGVVSAFALWATAVVNDHAGRLLEALGYVLRALEADPAMVPGEQSLHVIVARCREAVVDGDGPAEDRLALCRALAENSLDDDYVREALAELLLERGEAAEALRVAQALTVLSPRSASAWKVVHSAAKALGDEKLATEAAGRCAAARCAEGPGLVPPGARWGQA